MVDRSLVKRAIPYAIQSTSLNHLGTRYEGKVRDVYKQDGTLLLITTDRISSFDHVLPEPIPFKGQVLNQLAAFFFEASSGDVPNHVISVPDPNVMVARRTEPFLLEFVVRGYLAGHAWRTYRAGKRVLCGVRLPDGLKQNSPLPQPILTPTTKAASGHDQDISAEDAIKEGIIKEGDFEQLREYAFRLFEIGSKIARKQGLILVDTKYEFGRAPNGDVLAIDEIHTPDSSRYFLQDGYQERLDRDEPQRQLSKEFVREWLMDNGFSGQEGERIPNMPEDFRVDVALRYIELYERLTGKTFQPPSELDLSERLRAISVDELAYDA